MKKSLILVVLVAILCVGVVPAKAGGILEWLFGSRPKVVQYFSPAVAGSLMAYDRYLNEITFDLNGDGNRIVLAAGIPVEKDTLLVGMALPATGDRRVKSIEFRLDGDWEALQVIPIERGENQKSWLRRAMRAMKPGFYGVSSGKAPFIFCIETSLLLNSAHAIEVFVRQDGKNGQGAATTLPFRIVEAVDEETGEVAPQGDLDQAVSEFSLRGIQEPEIKTENYSFLPDWEERIRNAVQQVVGTDQAGLTKFSVWDNPIFTQPPVLRPVVIMYILDGNGLVQPSAFYAEVNEENMKYSDDGDGIFYSSTLFDDLDVFSPIVFGEKVFANDEPLSLTLEVGKIYIIPVVRENGQWNVY